MVCGVIVPYNGGIWCINRLKRTKEVERHGVEQVQVTVAFSDSTESSSSCSLEDSEAVSLSELELPQFNVNRPDRWKEKLKQTDRFSYLF